MRCTEPCMNHELPPSNFTYAANFWRETLANCCRLVRHRSSLGLATNAFVVVASSWHFLGRFWRGSLNQLCAAGRGLKHLLAFA